VHSPWTKTAIVAVLLALLIASAACGLGETRIEWIGTSVPGRMEYSFRTFTGTEKASQILVTDQTLVVSYDATLEKGSITIRVAGPDKEVLEEVVLDASASGTLEVTTPGSGTYEIIVRGDDAGGSLAALR